MKYLLMINGSEDWLQLPQEENARVLQGHQVLVEKLRGEGKFVYGSGLMPSMSAKTVRKTSNGGHKVTDGPFAEGKEVMGGFYVVECDSIDEAVEWAKQIPSSLPNAVEVRPMAHTDEP